ncbi:MAG TPA: hydantoinase/carbamoylase family amidase [Thermomicrobiales bacterium]|nr:hydantoinase/carbamoylase family amidase [Thermomicrobiales bacterium]
MSPTITLDPSRIERDLMSLARHGAYGETGVWRTVYSPEWVAAQDQIAEWAAEAGLAVWRDAVGSVWGRLAGTGAGKSIVTGSHIDSQAPGGRYDGALGVVAALTAVRTLHEQFGQPRRTLEIVSLCEEESSRFPSASFWGSRAITGVIEDGETESVIAYSGESIGQAMRDVGLDPARISDARRDDIEHFIELHVEQGPILEGLDIPVGIVNAITGLRHYVVELTGRSDHAGARPMDTRRDPMEAASHIIAGAVGYARALGRPAVTTVGRMLVEPNLPAAVPDRVTFTIDSRSPIPEQHVDLQRHHEDLIRRVAAERDIDVDWRITADHQPCISDPDLVTLLERSAASQCIRALTMHSGAGHDTQRMALECKVAMIFVRSIGGRSHTPAEYSTIEDISEGIRLLTATLHELAYSRA